MKKLTFFLFTVFSTALAFAQHQLPEFGKIDIADLLLKSCPFEPDAPAMKLFDVEKTEFDLFTYGDTKIRTERRARIKIFNAQGYKYANFRIPYLSKKGLDKIKELKGIIYSLDESGKIVRQELEKKDFLKEKLVGNVGLVNFTFPNLKPGSVIEFSYTRIEKSMIQIDPWIIQSEIPTVYSSFIITTPVSSQLNEKIFGSDSVDKKTELLKYDQFRRTSYFKENIISFKPEPYMSSEKDNLMKMIFFHYPNSNSFARLLASSQEVWKYAGNYLLQAEFFGGQIKKAIPGTEEITDSSQKILSVARRIRFIYESVKKRIPEKEEQSLYADDISDAWKNRSGNTAEINLVLLNLLIKANIRCFPILVSTRENGKISKDFPSFSQLNGIDVVAMLDSVNYYLLDASLKFQSINTPPLNVLNREGFLLNPDHMDWFLINDDRPLLKQNINLFCDLREDGIIEGDATLQYYDYAKSYALDSTLEANDDKRAKFLDEKTTGLTITNIKRENQDDDEEPLNETVSFTYELPHTNNFYFIAPGFLFPKKDNPFKADNRFTDIDLGCNQEIISTLDLSFPSSFEVEHLPQNITVRAPDSSFLFKRVFSSDASHVYMREIFKIIQPIFTKEEYEGVKDFFKRMYVLKAEEVILKSKK